MIKGITAPVFTVEGKVKDTAIQFQVANDYVGVYRLLCSYLESELLSNPDQLSQQNLQTVLSRRVSALSLLNNYSFDDDFRVQDLIALLAIFYTIIKTGPQRDDHVLLPAWQLPGQKSQLKDFSGEESWDGFILAVPVDASNRIDQSRAVLPIPIETKSTMGQPREAVIGGPNDEIRRTLERFTGAFQNSGAISCVLVMPYTDTSQLSIDLSIAAQDMHQSMSKETARCICLLSFPTSKEGKLRLSVLCMVTPQDLSALDQHNVKSFMRDIRFGESKTPIAENLTN